MYKSSTQNRNFYIEVNEKKGQNMSLAVPEFCPICNCYCEPKFLKNSYNEHETVTIISAFFYCGHCKSTYCASYQIENYKIPDMQPIFVFSGARLTGISPNESNVESFKYSEVIELSPRSNEIFKQSQRAENYSLDEIAGMGYRKTLEILVKDYLIKIEPEQEESIKKKELGKCINDLKDENLKTLASRCAWLGNDESHYIRKHTELDINTLKDLLDGLITFIHLKLIVERASDIEPK